MTTLTTAQQIRLKIADIPRLADKTFYGDGTASAFLLPDVNLTSGSAFVPGTNTWTSTGATFNVSGMVSFSATISANSAFRVTYVYSVFSDDEIDNFLLVGGDVLNASLEAIQTLMFDAAKRASWGGSDGSTYDDTVAADNLYKAWSAIQDIQFQQGAAEIGLNSWTLNQQDF